MKRLEAPAKESPFNFDSARTGRVYLCQNGDP